VFCFRRSAASLKSFGKIQGLEEALCGQYVHASVY
jgi:hypothetical protein